MKTEDWYMWEKSPGVIGVSWICQLERHCDAYVASFTGTIDEAIKYAKQLEEKGYDVTPKDSKGNDVVKKKPAIVLDEFENQLSFGLPQNQEPPKRARKQRGQKQKEKDPFEGYEAEGQLSLFDAVI